MARLDLAKEHEDGGTRDAGSRLGIAPGQGVGFVLDGVAQNFMIGRVIMNLVNSAPNPVEGQEFRGMTLRFFGLLLELRTSDKVAHRLKTTASPVGTVTLNALHERSVGVILIDPFARGHLIGNIRHHKRHEQRTSFFLRVFCCEPTRRFRGLVLSPDV